MHAFALHAGIADRAACQKSETPESPGFRALGFRVLGWF